MRLAENGTVYRNELSGALHGLTRVRGFTQDDSHLFVTPEQLEERDDQASSSSSSRCCATSASSDFELELSMRDDEKDKWIGTDEFWEYSTDALRNVALASGLKLTEVPGEAAFYGPKIDLKTTDAIGRTWQLSTVQVDPNLPERFELEYTDRDGQKKRPDHDPPRAVRLDRAVLRDPARALRRRVPGVARRRCRSSASPSPRSTPTTSARSSTG